MSQQTELGDTEPISLDSRSLIDLLNEVPKFDFITSEINNISDPKLLDQLKSTFEEKHTEYSSALQKIAFSTFPHEPSDKVIQQFTSLAQASLHKMNVAIATINARKSYINLFAET